jgi:hypothetical protein
MHRVVVKQYDGFWASRLQQLGKKRSVGNRDCLYVFHAPLNIPSVHKYSSDQDLERIPYP